jgi:hypothetical protein
VPEPVLVAVVMVGSESTVSLPAPESVVSTISNPSVAVPVDGTSKAELTTYKTWGL